MFFYFILFLKLEGRNSIFEGLDIEYLTHALDMVPRDIKAFKSLETISEKEDYLDSLPYGQVSRLQEFGGVPASEVVENLTGHQLKALEGLEPSWRIAILDSMAKENAERSNIKKVRIMNKRDDDVQLFWDDGKRGTLLGVIRSGQNSEINVRVGNKFFAKDKKGFVVKRFEIVPERYMYRVPLNRKLTAEEKQEKRFMRRYSQTTGRKWVNMYPRDPPQWRIITAEEIGDTIEVASPASFFEPCIPIFDPGSDDTEICIEGLREIPTCPVFNIEVLCDDPSIHVLQSDILTKVERDIIIKLSLSRLKPSVVKVSAQDDRRKSETGWLYRHDHQVIDALVQRVGDILGIPQKVLYSGKGGIFEGLQVVRYPVGGYYKKHYDFFQYTQKLESRFATFLIYLNDVEKGGETSFPRAARDCPKKIHPGAGRGLWFYNMLPDGNFDTNTLHAGLSSDSGEKWICNLWFWDPKTPFLK